MDTCAICGKVLIPDGIAAGYGINDKGEKICYECCAKLDMADLTNLKHGEKICFYLSKNKSGQYEVTNWPGSMRIKVDCSWEGRHNIAGKRTDVRFHVGKKHFHGVQYGNWTQICHIKLCKTA